MEDLQEQVVCMKIGFNQGKILQNLSKCQLPYGEQKIGEQKLFEWHSKFKSSVTSGEGAECTDVY